jgi:plastocyanin domain-containing protein
MSGAAQRQLVRAAALTVLAVLVLLGWVALRPVPYGLQRAVEGHAATGPDGVSVLALRSLGGEYEPNVIHAAAGHPLRLRVTSHQRHACGDRLLFPDLGADFELPAAGDAELLLQAAPAGAYLFTCGMRMVKGVVLFE